MDSLILRQVPKERWGDILFECFSTDQDLIDEYHITSGTDVETCVKRTLTDLFLCKDLKIYAIYVNEKLAAYFGEEENCQLLFMTGFFIKPEFRNRFFVTKFWMNVRSVFDYATFYVGVYTKNKPALKFLNQEGEMVYQDKAITTFSVTS